MQATQSALTPREKLYYTLSGVGAGLCNGLLGSGGGIVLFFALTALSYGNQKDRFAACVLCMGVMSTVSALLYLANGHVALSDLPPYLLPALLGGGAGAVIAEKIRGPWLKGLFAVLMIWGGFRMIWGG